MLKSASAAGPLQALLLTTLLSLQHQQCLAAFSRVKFTRVLLTVLIAFTKKEVRECRDWSVSDSVLPALTVLPLLCLYHSRRFL